MVASKQREGIVRALDGVVLFLLVLQICFRVSVSSYSATVDSSVAPASHASNFLASALVFVAATVWLLRRFLTGGVTLRLSGIEAWLGIFVMASMFSMMFADYKLVAIEYVVSWGGLALLFALAMSAWGPERARLAVRLLLALGVVTVAYGIIQRVYLFGEIMRDPEAQRLLRTEAGRERLEERQVFSTFAYPNTFAAYLVAMCAVLAGLGMDAWRAGRRGWALASPVLLLSGSVVCLALTASKGGWVAGGVAAGVFVWLATRRRAVLGVLAAAALIGAALFAQTDSMRRRWDYWGAAAGVAAEHPLIGVGFLNYQDHFAQHKGDSPEESDMAHNDYLQVLCETGIVGLLALGGLFVWIAKRVRPVEGAALPPAAGDSPWIVGAAWLGGLGLAFAVEGTFQHFALAALLGVAGLMYLLLRSERDVEVGGRGLSIGIAAGLAGVAAHMLVDFDLYEHGLVEVLLLASAVGVMTTGSYRDLALGKTFAGVGAIFLAVVTVIFVLRPYAALSQGEALQRLARAELEEYERTQSVDRLTKARELLMAATATHEWNPEVFLALGRLHRGLAEQAKPADLRKAGMAMRGSDEASLRLRERVRMHDVNLGQALWAFDKARQLRPRSEEIHGELSAALLDRADTKGELRPFLEDRDGRLAAEIEALYFGSMRHAEEAARLYPWRPEIQYHLGVVYGRLDRKDEKSKAWRKAIRSHDGAPTDIRLTEAQAAEIRDFLKRLED